jgi:hypothetical protein
MLFGSCVPVTESAVSILLNLQDSLICSWLIDLSADPDIEKLQRSFLLNFTEQ